jgi:type II secretory ATPase GspE/PulE/Tfp pilus assembly ATPase PilB-like protein/CheY-like chemotaxis protein
MLCDSRFVMNSLEAYLQKLQDLHLITVEQRQKLVTRCDDSCILKPFIEDGILHEEAATLAIAQALNLEIVDLDKVEKQSLIQSRIFQTEQAPSICKRYLLLPLFQKDGSIVTACANPFAQEAIKGLSFALSEPIRLVLSLESQVRRHIGKLFPITTLKIEEPQDERLNEVNVIPAVHQQNNEADRPQDPPIIRLTNKIISEAIIQKASDIHLEPQPAGLWVRFRIDGLLHEYYMIPQRLERHIIARIKVMAKMSIEERRKPQDGRIRVQINNDQVDLRISSIPTAHGEKIVIRVLGYDLFSRDLASLGMSPSLEKLVNETIHKRGKLFLTTGPTGSGKTTTLYVGLQSLNDGGRNITTIEDPIEYRLPGVNQIQIHERSGVRFAEALRSVLRQDPDVIMIGEIRDRETLEVALQAAQTGHLVLSTIHTNDAPSAVTRMLDLAADPMALGSSLGCILAQRLIRKLCTQCAVEVDESYISLHNEFLNRFGIHTSTLRKPVGCEACRYLGYLGRQGIFSVLFVDNELSELISQRASVDTLTKSAERKGYRSLENAALEVLRDGITSIEEIKPLILSDVSLPLDASRHESIPHAVKSISSKAEIRGAEGKNILVVDDSSSVRKMLNLILKDEEVEVREAENGQLALEAVHLRRPDMIICDLTMPVMTGQQFLAKMKSHSDTGSIPIVMLTADDNDDFEVSLLEMGALSFLSKRLPTKVLKLRLHSLLKSLQER